MAPDVSPNVPNNLKNTLESFETLSYKERANRFKNLDKREQWILAEAIDKIFTSSLIPENDKEQLEEITNKLKGRVSSDKSIKEKPSSGWTAISQRIEKFVSPFFERRIAPLFAPLGRAFVSLAEKLGMMNGAILDKKLQDAVSNYRYRNYWKENYTKVSNYYVDRLHDTPKDFFEIVKNILSVTNDMRGADGVERESLQSELNGFLEQVNELSERIEEIDNLQQDLVSAEETLGNELSKPFVDARKSAQAAFESEAFKKIQSSILELRESASEASNEELSRLVSPMLQLKEAYVKERFLAGIAGKSKALEGVITGIKEQIRGLLLKTPESAAGSLELGSVDLAAEDTLKAASDQAIKDQTRTPYYLVTDARENRAYLRKTNEYRGEEIEQYETLPKAEGFDVQTILPSEYSEEQLKTNLIQIENGDRATRELSDLMSCQSAHSLAAVKIIDTKGLMDTTSRYYFALTQRGVVNRLHLERNERGELERGIACIRTDFSLIPKSEEADITVSEVASLELYMTFVPHTPDEKNLYYFDVEDVDWKVKWINNPEAHEGVDTQGS